MNYRILGFFISFTFFAFQSCKLESSNDREVKTKSGQEKDAKRLSLYQMETINKVLIDSVEKRILEQVKQGDFVNMFKEADTSLVRLIDASDVKEYFKMIDRFYGHIDTLKMYGTTSTENGKRLDYIVNFSSGDSLELNYNLLFYKHDVKLSYITMNRFQKDAIPLSIVSNFKPKIDNIFKRNVELVYNECTTMFKSKITRARLSNLLDKNLKNNNSVYELVDCKPLIFGKSQVGFLVKAQKVMKDGMTKKINIPFFIDEYGAFKMADIQISK